MYKYSDLNCKVCRSSQNCLFIEFENLPNQDIFVCQKGRVTNRSEVEHCVSGGELQPLSEISTGIDF